MPTYKVRQVLRDLESKCEVVPNNNGSHQKFKNPKTGQTAIVPAHFRRDLSEHFVKNIYRQLGLKLDY